MHFNSLRFNDIADPNSNKMSDILIICAWTTIWSHGTCTQIPGRQANLYFDIFKVKVIQCIDVEYGINITIF